MECTNINYAIKESNSDKLYSYTNTKPPIHIQFTFLHQCRESSMHVKKVQNMQIYMFANLLQPKQSHPAQKWGKIEMENAHI